MTLPDFPYHSKGVLWACYWTLPGLREALRVTGSPESFKGTFRALEELYEFHKYPKNHCNISGTFGKICRPSNEIFRTFGGILKALIRLLAGLDGS